MKSSKRILLTLALIGLIASAAELNAQDKEKKKRDRDRWERVEPVRPVPPVPPVPPIPPTPPIDPIAPIAPISPIAPIEPIAPIQPIAPFEPIPPIEPIAPIAPIAPVISMDWDSNGLNYTRFSDRETDFSFELRGKLRLNGSRDAIRSISREGYLSIKEKRGGEGREIFVEQDENGELVYDFYRKGKKLSFENEGEKWLKEIWKDLVKNLD